MPPPVHGGIPAYTSTPPGGGGGLPCPVGEEGGCLQPLREGSRLCVSLIGGGKYTTAHKVGGGVGALLGGAPMLMCVSRLSL